MFGKKKPTGRHSAEHAKKDKQELIGIAERNPAESPAAKPDALPVHDSEAPAEEKTEGTTTAGENEEISAKKDNAPEEKDSDKAKAAENASDEKQDEENSKKLEMPEKESEKKLEEPVKKKEKTLSAKTDTAADNKATSDGQQCNNTGNSGEKDISRHEKSIKGKKNNDDRKAEKGSKGSIPSIPAILICAILIAAIAFVMLMIIKLNVLPSNLIIAAGLILAGLAFICVALTWSTKKPVRFAVGMFFTIVMLAGLVIGSFAMKKAWDTAQKVTASSVTLAEVGVYVNADDKATTIADLGGYTFGVLKTQDRDDANKALLDIAADLDLTIYVAEYDNVIKLISALYKHQVQAAVVETYHIEMLASMEDSEYTEIAELVRLVGQYEVESSSAAVSSYEFGDIGDSPLRKEEETPVEQGYEDHTFCIYVSGIDSFGPVNVKSRSDVNVLAFINDKTHQIFLVSTPRDYYVLTTVSGDQRDKLTHAGLYGPECSMGTLANLYECDVDYYFRINFSGFVDVVNALGGLDVEIWDGYPKVHLDGEDALLIARDRHSIGGETNRGDRHMSIISAVIDQVLSTDIIYNYNDVLDAVSDSFDTSVPYELISRIVKEQIESNPSWEIIKYKVSGYGGSDFCFSLSIYDETGGQAYVMYPNYDTVQIVHDLVRAMERNERISDPNAG
ncbi:MAG: LCP family protein [Oscillospiraceae bacterium]|nr:LCP family protein [Oscillospiraceae bacterium]